MTEDVKTQVDIATLKEMMNSQNRVLAEILEQTKKTNGRVGKHDDLISGIKEEMAETRGRAKVTGALWGVASSFILFVLGRMWR